MSRRTVCLRILSSLALAIGITATVSAQSFAIASAASAADVTNRWTRIGPDGGEVTALAASPSQPATVYAGLRNFGGVYRSTNGGLSWTFAGTGLGPTSIKALAVDAAQPGTVYAVADITLFRSVNGGASWAPVNVIPSPPSVVTVAADPQRSGIVYASLESRDIFVSTNRGRTWNDLGGPLDTTTRLVIDPVSPTILYAGTLSSGAFKSTDGGIRWKAITRGIHPSLTTVAALAIDPRHPQTLFLSPRGGAPYRSVDGGGHWTTSVTGLPQPPDVNALAVDPASSSVVFAGTPQNGVFRSADGGLTWRPAGAGLTGPAVNALLAAKSGLFVGGQSGVAASRDRAQTWTIGRGVRGSAISSLAIDAQNPPRMYAFDGARLWKNASRGARWNQLPLPAPSGSDFLQVTGPVAVHPDNPQQIELGFIDGVARSDDGGQSWVNHFGVDCFHPQHIVLDPSDPEVFYTHGSGTGSCGIQPDACDSYKFDHGQVSCLRKVTGSPQGWHVIAVDPASPSRLFSGFEPLYQSLDAGATWSALADAIHPFDLIFDPVHSGILYAAVTNGVARSIDNGVTWEVGTAGFPPLVQVISLAIDPGHPSTLYASTGLAVYQSTDSGATWARLGTGLDEVLPVQIALDPLDPGILYAATYGGGVMMLRLPR